MDVSAEIIDSLRQLLPGFLAAWVFHALTPHETKKEWTERIIQALIFTVLIQAVVPIIRVTAFGIGKFWKLGTWTTDSTLIWSCVVALLFGCFATWCANSDKFHGWLRKLKLTREVSYPSNWCAAFSDYEWYVVLHLKGGKRLYGWPVIWPNRHDAGHFIISQPAWFLDDGQPVELPQLERIVIPAADVTMVEQYRKATSGLTDYQIRTAQEPLAKLHRKEKRRDRRKQPTAGTEKHRSGPTIVGAGDDRARPNVNATGARLSDGDSERAARSN